MKKLQIGIIGNDGWSSYPNKKPDIKAYKIAYELGMFVAKYNAILICGGKGGVMQESCKGAKKNNGLTVGIVSGNKRSVANKYIDVEVVSGLINHSEEVLIVSMSDGIIAIGGGAGTLEEIALAYRNSKPIVVIKNIPGWANNVADTYLDERNLVKIESATTAKQAIELLFKKIKQKSLEIK